MMIVAVPYRRSLSGFLCRMKLCALLPWLATRACCGRRTSWAGQPWTWHGPRKSCRSTCCEPRRCPATTLWSSPGSTRGPGKWRWMLWPGKERYGRLWVCGWVGVCGCVCVGGVCVHMCVCVCVWVGMCASVWVWVQGVGVCKCVCVCMDVRGCAHVCVCWGGGGWVCVWVFMCVCVWMCMCACMCMCVCMCACVCMHACVCACVCMCVFWAEILTMGWERWT